MKEQRKHKQEDSLSCGVQFDGIKAATQQIRLLLHFQSCPVQPCLEIFYLGTVFVTGIPPEPAAPIPGGLNYTQVFRT